MATKHAQKLVQHSLEELGLTQHETELYLLSLRLGPAPATKLAAELKITRPNIYKVIAGLEKHGLAAFSQKKGINKNFMVESPTKIVERLREKKQTIQTFDVEMMETMPDLLALYQQGELPTSIRIFEGADQFQKLFFQTLDEAGKEFQFFGSADDFIQHVSREKHANWMEIRKRRGIRVKALFLPHKTAQAIEADNDPLRETRFLKDFPTFITSFFLFANKIILWQPKAPLAVLIEDQYIVAMLRAMFFGLWQASKER
ncbi:hypothetical protein KBD34_00545 [Patescibacteria group bacterium]|nr:hypothetical protein [Patescibacteria group bacterium]